jgi:ribonuclease P protein component
LSFPDAAGRDGSASRSDGRPSGAGFPRWCRLTTRRQFLAVRARGRRVSSSSFTLVGMRNELDTSRLGLTVSRKVGGSVQRNRVKRMLREVFRYNRAALTPHLDLVVLAKPGIQMRAVAQLQAEFLSDFRELARKVGR